MRQTEKSLKQFKLICTTNLKLNRLTLTFNMASCLLFHLMLAISGVRLPHRLWPSSNLCMPKLAAILMMLNSPQMGQKLPLFSKMVPLFCGASTQSKVPVKMKRATFLSFSSLRQKSSSLRLAKTSSLGQDPPVRLLYWKKLRATMNSSSNFPTKLVELISCYYFKTNSCWGTYRKEYFTL